MSDEEEDEEAEVDERGRKVKIVAFEEDDDEIGVKVLAGDEDDSADERATASERGDDVRHVFHRGRWPLIY